MKQVLAIRHVAFEDLGTFEPAFIEAGYAIEYIDAPTADLQTIDVDAPDVVVILGGPIGAYEDDKYPFLRHEVALIEQRLMAGRALLGICLGAQLIARASGARVYPGERKEIEWGGVSLTEAGKQSMLAPLSAGLPVLHWHGDTFDLPPGAELLASTVSYANQAFSVGPQVLGLQFHIETCARTLERWLVGHAVELAHAGIDIQSLRKDASDPSAASSVVLRGWLNLIELST
ncbi:glutamine amidotransferase [Paraburkholderia sp. GAS42]|uniref:glutamine amidotransferase n=1 Tax=Paraburkholderia sp. GAS42 TaxID=3035135 RepID=UPI003D240601